MSDALPRFQQRREEILSQMHAIDRLRRGTLSRQFFKKRKGGKITQQGPYFVLQCFLKGKKCSERVPADQAAKVEQEVANYQRFQALAEEFVAVTDQITRLENGSAESKKNSSRRRSPPSSSANPKPS